MGNRTFEDDLIMAAEYWDNGAGDCFFQFDDKEGRLCGHFDNVLSATMCEPEVCPFFNNQI